MFSQHLSAQLSAYVNEELSAENRGRVAQHLISCARCRAEFDCIKLGARVAQQIPVTIAPAAIWAGIVNGLEKDNGRVTFLRFLKPVAIAATILLLLSGGLLWLRVRQSKSNAYWQAARLAGSPRIGSTSLGDKGRLVVGQWLETDANSRAQLDVSTIGNVEIDPNTRVRLLESKPTEQRLELARGRLSAKINAPPKLFFVNTPSGVAADLGCAYTLEVDDQGNSIVHVTLGWVALELTDRESKVPAGAACVTKRGIGPGTPYYEDATESFRAALSRFDFEDAPAKTAALPVLLTEAHPHDTMTLWYVLSRVDQNERSRVYDRMAAFVPPPPDVTRAGILNLDQTMLDRWKEEIDLASNLSLGTVWKKVWTTGLGKVNGFAGKK